MAVPPDNQQPNGPDRRPSVAAGLRNTARNAVNEVRESIDHVRTLSLTPPPRHQRLRRFGYGLALPFTLLATMLRDPVRRREYLRTAIPTALLTFVLGVFAVASPWTGSYFLKDQERAERHDRNHKTPPVQIHVGDNKHATAPVPAVAPATPAGASPGVESPSTHTAAPHGSALAPPRAGQAAHSDEQETVSDSESDSDDSDESDANEGEEVASTEQEQSEAAAAVTKAALLSALDQANQAAEKSGTSNPQLRDALTKVRKELDEQPVDAPAAQAGKAHVTLPVPPATPTPSKVAVPEDDALLNVIANLRSKAAAMKNKPHATDGDVATADKLEATADRLESQLEDRQARRAERAQDNADDEDEAPAPAPNKQWSWPLLSALGAALTLVEWWMLALTRDHQNQLSRKVALASGATPEDPERTPRVRLDVKWLVKKLRRKIRGALIIGSGVVAFAVVRLIPHVGREASQLAASLWAFYWIAVFTLGGTAAAWTIHAPKDPWFVRGSLALGKIPLLGWFPRLYGKVWRGITKGVRSPCEVWERAPYEGLGMGLARVVCGLPVIYSFVRPVFSVAAQHAVRPHVASDALTLPPPPGSQPIEPSIRAGAWNEIG